MFLSCKMFKLFVNSLIFYFQQKYTKGATKSQIDTEKLGFECRAMVSAHNCLK